MVLSVEGELVPEAATPIECGTIQLSRVQGGYRDMLRRYTVLVDDAPAGRIGRGQTLRLDVPPGAHRLQLKISWCTSPSLTAEVESGKSVYFTCSPGGDASDALAAVTVNAGSYIALWQTPDPV